MSPRSPRRTRPVLLPCAAALFFLLDLATTPPAGAVGLDGAADARTRLRLGLGAGIDQVGGYGRDLYPFLEVGGQAESLVWRRLVVGGGASLRADAGDYNFALGAWRGRRAIGVVAQVFAGYDGPGFHVSAGPWLYGSSRDRDEFRGSLLPYGILRLRFGHLDRWHGTVHVADGAPFTAEGGSLGARVLVGAPARGRHRLSGGLYTSLGEKTLGLAFTDEISGAGSAGSALRLGGLAGIDLGFPGRPELTLFAAFVW